MHVVPKNNFVFYLIILCVLRNVVSILFIYLLLLFIIWKKQGTEYVTHITKKSSCSIFNLQRLPGNHCTGMLLQLVDDTILSARVAKTGLLSNSHPPIFLLFQKAPNEQVFLQLTVLCGSMMPFKLECLEWRSSLHLQQRP